MIGKIVIPDKEIAEQIIKLRAQLDSMRDIAREIARKTDVDIVLTSEKEKND
ncbi:hypothetical protein [Megasphaera sueciensis]|uniref:hypothetical protein n=1 Tax=Megasphaera sueciensis TaxID=349094 RepID=UPI003D01D147